MRYSPCSFSTMNYPLIRSTSVEPEKISTSPHETAHPTWTPKACKMKAQTPQKWPEKPLVYTLLGSKLPIPRFPKLQDSQTRPLEAALGALGDLQVLDSEKLELGCRVLYVSCHSLLVWGCRTSYSNFQASTMDPLFATS